MAGLINSLIETVKGQTVLFKEVTALLVQKKEYVIQNDIENLRAVVKLENDIVPKILKGDKTREQLMADIATVLNKRPDELTFTMLKQLISSQPEHPAFVAAVDEFVVALDEMKAANDNAKTFISDALDYIDFNMNVIHSSFEAVPAGYGDLDDSLETGSFIDSRS
ncbi:MAG: flagellar protein FlgN [Defluviitaleaceae bacterium]|nr:flagellar protein FlgN [Defluviitaleaceae bacterium]